MHYVSSSCKLILGDCFTASVQKSLERKFGKEAGGIPIQPTEEFEKRIMVSHDASCTTRLRFKSKHCKVMVVKRFYSQLSRTHLIMVTAFIDFNFALFYDHIITFFNVLPIAPDQTRPWSPIETLIRINVANLSYLT